MPNISVVITTQFKQPALLNRAINSCKLQAVDVEVVVVALGTDWQRGDLAGHPGVDKVVKDTGKGISNALNMGHKVASGTFHFTLGEESHLMHGSLARLLAAHAAEDDPVHVFTYGDVQLKDRVHVTPEWVPGVNGGNFRTSSAALWHASVFPECYFRHPAHLPYFYPDYDFFMQLERRGVRGVKVPVVTIEWITRSGDINDRARPYQQQIREWINNNA